MTLGRIIVDLLARTGSFDTDLNRSAKLADKRAREIDAAFRRAGKAIGVALAAGATAAVVALKSTIDKMDDMSKAAQKVGLPTEEFSKLTYAADLADVSMDTLTTSLGRLTKAQAAALKENSTQARVFDALGISIKDVEGNLRSSSAVLSDFADRFQELKGSPEAMAAGFTLFGRGFQEIIPLLKDGSAGIREAGDELEALGGVLSTDAGRQAEEFNDNLDRLKTAATGFGLSIAQELLPHLVELTDTIVEWNKDGSTAKEVADDLASGFEVLKGAVHVISSVFEVAGAATAAWAAESQALFKILSGLMTLDYNKVRNGFNLAIEGATGVSDEFQEAIGNDQRSATKTNKPDFSRVRGTFTGPPTNVDRKKLRDAFAGGGGSKKKAKAGGKSDEEREAERLAAAYKNLEDSLKEQIALHGQTTEVARVRYEVEHGALQKLGQAQKDNLLALAAQRDAQLAHEDLMEKGKQLTESLLTPTEELNQKRKEAADLLKAGAISQEAYNKAIAAYRDPGQQMVEDLQFELELLKMTNAERATAIQLRGMDAEQIRQYGAEIAGLNKQIEESAKQAQFMDEFRGSLVDAFTDVVTGAKSAKDAFKDFFDNLAEMVTRMIAERWIEQAFGSFGSTGQGTTGGDWLGSIFGALFGGARANGGPVMGGGSYLVGERGPELFVPRTAGTVVPAQQTARMSGGGMTQINNITVPGRPDRRTLEQIERASGRGARRGMARTGA